MAGFKPQPLCFSACVSAWKSGIIKKVEKFLYSTRCSATLGIAPHIQGLNEIKLAQDVLWAFFKKCQVKLA